MTEEDAVYFNLANLTNEQKAELKDNLDKLAGRGKHKGWSNICAGDVYYANSLRNKWGASISKLEEVIKPYRKEMKRAKKAAKEEKKVKIAEASNCGRKIALSLNITPVQRRYFAESLNKLLEDEGKVMAKRTHAFLTGMAVELESQ